MRVLITGVTGMAGSHPSLHSELALNAVKGQALAEYILANHPDVELYGMCRCHADPQWSRGHRCTPDRVKTKDPHHELIRTERA
jgi:nucleoside-diphosphate-sugar epimerase